MAEIGKNGNDYKVYTNDYIAKNVRADVTATYRIYGYGLLETDSQLLVRVLVDGSDGEGRIEKAQDTWANRLTATYKAI